MQSEYGLDVIPPFSVVLVSPLTEYFIHVPRAHRELWIIFDPLPQWVPYLQWGMAHSPARRPAFPLLDDTNLRSKMIRLMRSTIEYFTSPLSYGPRMAELTLEQVLLLSMSLAKNEAKINPRIEQVIKLMQGNLSKRWREEELAGSLGLSRTGFAHLFKREIGLPPLKYFERLRFENAKSLLLATNKSIGEIAKAIGYEESQHFSRRFHQLNGKSPSQYRSGL